MTNHTPGPWHKTASDAHGYVYADNGTCIAPFCEHSAEKMDVERSANARLIAAAPELLELAQAFLSYLEDKSNSERRRLACIAGARAAIAKATGDK